MSFPKQNGRSGIIRNTCVMFCLVCSNEYVLFAKANTGDPTAFMAADPPSAASIVLIDASVSSVLSTQTNAQIFPSIVQSVEVDMVDDLAFSEGTAKHALCDNAMQPPAPMDPVFCVKSTCIDDGISDRRRTIIAVPSKILDEIFIFSADKNRKRLDIQMPVHLLSRRQHGI